MKCLFLNEKALEGDDADPEGLAEAEKALEGAQATLAEAQKTLDEAQKTLTEAEAAKDAVLQYPSRAFVANVVREDRIKFFGIPRCGSYCAAAVKYDSALHAEEPLSMASIMFQNSLIISFELSRFN